MKILLIGEYYSDNLGDPLLCQTVESIIKDAYPQAEVIPFDMSGKTSQTSTYLLGDYDLGTKIFLKLIQLFPEIFLKSAFFRAYKANEHRYLRVWCTLNELLKLHKFDLAIFAGGSLFMDYFAGVIYMIVKRLGSTKIIFHACGMSRLDADSEYLLNYALRSKNIRSISLRDSYMRFLDLFPTHAEVIETYDTALGCSNYYNPAPTHIADYGIGLMEHSSFAEQQKQLILQLLESKVSWKVFTNGARHDYVHAKKILAECGITECQMNDYLVPRPCSSDEFVTTVTQFKKIISFRMHSLIVANSFGIPCFGFAWDYKVVDLFEKLGLPHNYATEKISFGEIENTLNKRISDTRAIAAAQSKESQICLIQSVSKALSK